jgi:hypothetical protein
MISELRIHRRRGTTVGFLLESQKLENQCGQVARTHPVSREKKK